MKEEIENHQKSYNEEIMREEHGKKEELTALQSMFKSVESELNKLRSENSSANEQIVVLRQNKHSV